MQGSIGTSVPGGGEAASWSGRIATFFVAACCAAALGAAAALWAGRFGDLPEATSAGVGVVVGAAAAVFGCRRFAPRRRTDDTEEFPADRLRALVAVILLLQFAYLPFVDLLSEEALHWARSKHLAAAYVDHPGGVAWIVAMGTAALGDGPLGVRAGAFACSLIAALFLYRTGREAAGSRGVGLLTAAAYLLCPYYLGVGFFVFPDSMLMACWAAAVFYGGRAAGRGRTADWLLFGLSAGLGLNAKFTMGAVGLAMVVHLLFTADGRKAMRTAGPYLGGLASLAAFSPVLIYQIQEDWPSVRFQIDERTGGDLRFDLPMFLFFLTAAVGPVILAACIASAVAAIRGPDRLVPAARWQILAGAVPLLAVGGHSLLHPVRIAWAAPAVLSLLPLAAAFLFDRSSRHPRWRAGLASAARISTGICLVLLCFSYAAVTRVIRVDVPLGRISLLSEVTWHKLGACMDEVRQRARAEGCGEILLIGLDRYGLAAELSYYASRENLDLVTSRNALGQYGLTWNGWSDLEPWRGRTVYLVARKEGDLLRNWRVDCSFERLSPVEELDIGAGPGRKILYGRFGYGYRPFPRPGRDDSAP